LLTQYDSSVNAMQPLTTREAILGIYLKDAKIFRETRRKVKAELFGDLKWLFETMVKLDDQDALNFKTVVLNHSESAMFLHHIKNETGSTNAIDTLINQLKQEHLSFHLENVLYSTQLNMRSEAPNDVLSALKNAVDQLTITECGEPHDPVQDVEEWYGWLQAVMENPGMAYGLLTGIEDMDRITTGFHRQDFIVVGARTSMGKSAFMLDVVLKLTANNYKCAIWSLEMSKRQIYLRTMANLLNCSLEVLKTGQLAKERLPEVKKYKEFLKKLYIDDTRGVSADYIADEMRRIKRTRGLDFVVVDYIQDVKEKGEQNDNGGSAIARVCRKLRSAAQQCDVPVMALSQVTRDVESRQDKRPGSADLAGSTGIETSADVIAMLYRDEYYNPGTTKTPGIIEVNFCKQRNGGLGKVELFYDKRCQRISSLSSKR